MTKTSRSGETRRAIPPSTTLVGMRILVQRDDAGIFPASTRTPRSRCEIAEIIDMPERYDPSAGRRQRWHFRTDLGTFSADPAQKLIWVK